jgi:hypothetical protein
MDTKIFSVNFRYINTLIVILTTSIFIGLITREYRDLERYMGYVAENGRSALSHAEYINQNMAFQLSRAFSVLPASPVCKRISVTRCANILNRPTVFRG